MEFKCMSVLHRLYVGNIQEFHGIPSILQNIVIYLNDVMWCACHNIIIAIIYGSFIIITNWSWLKHIPCQTCGTLQKELTSWDDDDDDDDDDGLVSRWDEAVLVYIPARRKWLMTTLHMSNIQKSLVVMKLQHWSITVTMPDVGAPPPKKRRSNIYA